MSTPFYQVRGTASEPLTFKEEIRLAKIWRKGNINGKPRTKAATAARDRLIAGYLLFTIKTVHRRFPTMDEDMRLQVSHDTVLSAINVFDPYRKKDKLGRLSNLIPFHLLECMRKHRRAAQVVTLPMKRYNDIPGESLDATTSRGQHSSMNTEVDGYERCEIIEERAAPEVDLDALMGLDEESPADRGLREERLAALTDAMASLKSDSRRVLHEHFFKGQNFAEIGRHFGISREAVRQRHAKALVELRDALAKRNIFSTSK